MSHSHIIFNADADAAPFCIYSFIIRRRYAPWRQPMSRDTRLAMATRARSMKLVSASIVSFCCSNWRN